MRNVGGWAMAALTAGCGGADETDTAPDTDSPVTAAAFPEPPPYCAPRGDPFALATAEDLDAAWALRPRMEPLTTAMGAVRAASEAGACPALVDDPCGAGTVFTGGCEEGGVAASGSAVGTGCDDGGAWIWDGFSVTSASPAWSFAADGIAEAYVSGDGAYAYDVTFTSSGLCAGCDGTFTWRGEERVSGFAIARHHRVIAYPTTGATGSFCLDESVVVADASCEAEPVGWTVVQGDVVVALLWDGDVACDGCARRFVGGVEVEAWCR